MSLVWQADVFCDFKLVQRCVGWIEGAGTRMIPKPSSQERTYAARNGWKRLRVPAWLRKRNGFRSTLGDCCPQCAVELEKRLASKEPAREPEVMG